MSEYMWVKTENGIATVGITNEAQKSLGEVVYVDLPQIGVTVEQDKEMGTVESVKSVNDLISPVTGKVVEVNSALSESPESLNQDPEGDGWLVKVELPSYSTRQA